jgi:hypothetical protein
VVYLPYNPELLESDDHLAMSELYQEIQDMIVSFKYRVIDNK